MKRLLVKPKPSPKPARPLLPGLKRCFGNGNEKWRTSGDDLENIAGKAAALSFLGGEFFDTDQLRAVINSLPENACGFRQRGDVERTIAVFHRRTCRMVDDDAPARGDIDGINVTVAAVGIEDLFLQQPADFDAGYFQGFDKAGQYVAPGRPRHVDGGGERRRGRTCVLGRGIGRCPLGGHATSLRRLARGSMRVVKCGQI